MELERPRPSIEDNTATSNAIHNLGPAPTAPDFTAFRFSPTVAPPAQAVRQSRTTASNDQGVSSSVQSPQLSPSIHDPASKEILRSLSATETSFIDILHNLIRRNFTSELQGARHENGVNENTSNLGASTSSSSSSATQAAGSLGTLLKSLRQACTAIENPFEASEMRQTVVATNFNDGVTAAQEIRQRLDYLAPYFPRTSSASSEVSTSAQVAKNLAALLAMVKRLQELYQSSPILALLPKLTTPLRTPREEEQYFNFESEETNAAEASRQLYQALHKQAKAFQSANTSRPQASGPSSAALAVEEAEVELLWGRMSDLLENTTRELKLVGSPTISRVGNSIPSPDYIFGETPALSSDAAFFNAQHALPEYTSLDPPSYGSEAYENERERHADIKRADVEGEETHSELPRSRRRQPSKITVASDEKMQLDLDRMASAIERLYVSAPQLANQRVDAVRCNPEARQEKREMQLAKLGTAIERLSKGRLEDQRAALLQTEPNHFAAARAQSKNKSDKVEEASKQRSLEKLLQELDKAAARSLDGQRATIGSRGEKGSSLDPEEMAFREHVMASAGKGRMISQDASFSVPSSLTPAMPSSFAAKLAMKRRSLAHIYDDDYHENNHGTEQERRNRTRSSSVGALPTLYVPAVDSASTHTSSTAKMAIKKRFSVSRLLFNGKDAGRLTTPMSRASSKSTPTTSRPSSSSGNSTTQLIYTVEEMTNLGSMVMQAWEEDSPASNAINSHPEPLSLTIIDGKTARLICPSAPEHIEVQGPNIVLAAEVPAALNGQQIELSYKHGHYEAKIATATSQQFTRARNDLEIAVPYSARDFRQHRPASLSCASCSAQLAKLSQVTRYNDLPSEHWAELLDAWMCHPDQTLSKDIIEKGNNIWPQAGQALISTTGIILATENTKGWVVADDIEPTHLSDGKWIATRCKSCRALVGRSSPGPTRELHEQHAYVRFSKIAVQPASTSYMSAAPMSLHVMASLLETSLARAVHRFVIEDEEDGNIQLMLWMFNPYIRIFSNHVSFESASAINASKILYKTGELTDFDIHRMMGDTEYETLIYPRSICLQLLDLLETSTSVYPKSQQRLGEWQVGWLERGVSRG